jgi:hypothetical protein
MSSEHRIIATTKDTNSTVDDQNKTQPSRQNEADSSMKAFGTCSLDSGPSAILSNEPFPFSSTSAVGGGTKSITKLAPAPISVVYRTSQFALSLPSHPPLNNSILMPNIVPIASILSQQPLVVDAALLRHRQLASNMTIQPQSYPHLRSGKWLPAEENYALLLVALFERGMITDCVDRTTTLRTYMSQKLHCAPMRISKKFAGRGIGKLLYTCKLTSHERHKMPELLERLRIAERQFLQAAYPTAVAATLGVVAVSVLSFSTTEAHNVSM